MTWIESMSMEKALVTSNIGWAPEVMVDGVTGFTVSPSDHATCMHLECKNLLENEALRTQMGIAARCVSRKNLQHR